ncbi:hypothetical protein VMCG_03182 [Cytospora schulzeri]|uniref:SGNH hydrolase-type esterase domain-containing protein n=1 Tax=Cytospora schulzeri TaxID=448051 RepID=A0A423WY46_9PEZI|nr:hypothetical protein VMCG_03182 [Valsa malicola]
MDETQAESSADGAARATKTAPESIPSKHSLSEAQKVSKYKSRSLETSRDEHLPKVFGASQAISVVFLGDSMIERMTTTGKTGSLHLWPSETMCPEEEPQIGLRDTNIRRNALCLPDLVRVSGVLNAGCGGDKIENIIYRLIGDPERGLTGLAAALSTTKRQHKVKLWVIQAGTNNLHPKKGLTDASLQAYRVLLESILDIADRSTHILVTGLFYRKDIKNELVAQANTKLKKLVHDLDRELLSHHPDPEQQFTEGVVSRFATHTDVPQAIKVKDKGKAADPEERRDSAIGVAISPTATREGVDVKGKGKGKAKEEPPTTQETHMDEKHGSQLSTDRDPTMPQFKPNWWPSIFAKDPEAVGITRKPPASMGGEPSGMSPAEWLSGHKETDYHHPRIQFLPAPWANDPETWLEDHVHLHEEGYRLWTRKLFPKVKEMLLHAEEASP